MIESARRDQVLVAVAATPLDRIRLMKTAFLVWFRAGQPEEGPFLFQPYLYGPCAFDLYHTLDDLIAERMIVPVSAGQSSASYYITAVGRREAAEAARRLGPAKANEVSQTARWAVSQGFRSLLRQVYAEAPDFATHSVLR